jgi:protein O-mannosyl-transferase
MLIVGAVTATVHWPVLSAQALSFDDQQYLTNNLLVRHPSWRSAGRFLAEVFKPTTVSGYYQPLTMISLMGDYALGGRPDNLRQFHRTNLTLHVFNTALVVVFLYTLFRQPVPVALVALWFGLHPLTVEPIAWLCERKTLLAAFFTLACLLAYLAYTRRGGWRWLGASLALYVFAVMSKPTAVPIPILLLTLDYWPLRRLRRGSVIEKIPFFCVLALFAVVTLISQARAASVVMPGNPGSSRSAAVLCYAVPFYLGKIVWPTNLTSVYVAPDPLSLSNPAIALSALATCVVFAAVILSLRWTRALFAGWLFFFVAVFPTLGLVQFTCMIASDKYVYLPAVGLVIALAWILTCLWERAKPKGWSARLAWATAGLLVLALEARGVRHQLAYWTDSLALAERLLALAPHDPAAHTQMADALGRLGRREEAIDHYREILRLQPGNADTCYNLGMALRLQGELDEAITYLRKSVQADAKNADAAYTLGLAFQSQGRLEEAADCFQKALRVNPYLALARWGLGQIFHAQGRLDEAIAQFRQGLDETPADVDVRASLGAALLDRGDIEEAGRQLQRALVFNPNHARAHAELGRFFARQRNLDEAIAHFERALSITPNQAEVSYNFALALQLKGNLAEARRHYGEALRVKPDYAEAHNALGNLLVAEQPATALTHFREALRLKPNWAPPLNAAAWILATHPDASIRDEEEAIRLAEQAANLTEYRQAAVLDTLAAAYASAGRFEQAIAIARQALRLADADPSNKLGDEIRRRLEFYRQDRPYRVSDRPRGN